tara:strand:+ start:146 stop:502 length:357 start_codon:yes stop_codon:yes gene_type:complete
VVAEAAEVSTESHLVLMAALVVAVVDRTNLVVVVMVVELLSILVDLHQTVIMLVVLVVLTLVVEAVAVAMEIMMVVLAVLESLSLDMLVTSSNLQLILHYNQLIRLHYQLPRQQTLLC